MIDPNKLKKGVRGMLQDGYLVLRWAVFICMMLIGLRLVAMQ